jgi:hypothetical protein
LAAYRRSKFQRRRESSAFLAVIRLVGGPIVGPGC